jgi:hypothetical protein
MLRDVVVHILNEQPILADLLKDPAPSDVAVICSNLRTTNGKKPVFVDSADSTFVIPLAHVRFIEIHKASMDAAAAESQALVDGAGQARSAADAAVEEDENSLSGDPLARLAWLGGGQDSGEPAELDFPVAGAAHAGAGAPSANGSEPSPDEIDPDLLRRIREA